MKRFGLLSVPVWFAVTSCAPNVADNTEDPPAAPAASAEASAEESAEASAEESAEASAEESAEALAQQGWHPVVEAELSEAQRGALAASRQARAELGATLMRTVAEASAAGPEAGVAACQDAAPRLTAEAATPTLRIGRTSHRLRNPANQAPAWAAEHVAAQEASPALFAHADSRVAELVPIMTAAGCVGCHGERDTLTPALRSELAQRYPLDAATGFAEGELRGWFWTEIGSGSAL